MVAVASFIHREGCTSGYPAGYVRTEAQLAFINEVLSAADPGIPEIPEPEEPQQDPENPEVPVYY